MIRSRIGGAALSLTLTMVALAPRAHAAEEEAGADKIRDNLFLLEEAYNQEPGVIQHIQVFHYSRGGQWVYNFTEEWPVPTDLHQASVTLPVERIGSEIGLGDVLLNYRFQALGVGGKGALAVAPRLSVALPTGDWKTGHGRGGVGLHFNLPVSVDLSRHFTGHANAGLAYTPSARSPGAATESAVDFNAGAALVWLPVHAVNALVEVVYLSEEDAGARSDEWIVNPGLRFAIDFESGLQIVPGVSAPLVMDDSGVEASGLFYLSFEHPAF